MKTVTRPQATRPATAVTKVVPVKRETPAPASVRTTPRETVSVSKPAPKKKSKLRPVWILALAGLSLLLITLITIVASPSPTLVTVAPSAAPARPFNKFVAAPGLVEAVTGMRQLAFEVPGRISVIHVAEGERIDKGQVLAELDHGLIQAQVEGARAELNAAKARYEILKVELTAAERNARCKVDTLRAELNLLENGARKEERAGLAEELRAAEAEHARLQEDAQRLSDSRAIQSGAWSEKQRMDALRLAESALARANAIRERQKAMQAGTRSEELEKARANLDAGQAELDKVIKTTDARLQESSALAEQSAARMRKLELDLKNTRLVSPISGVVVSQTRYTGETVGVIPPEPLLSVADTETLRVRADVDEADFPQVKPGQKVKIGFDALRGKYLEGVVESVGAAAGHRKYRTGEVREKLDVQTIECLVRLKRSDAVKLGLRVTAYFELQD
jgi:HlyD family secretion protein